MSREFALRDYLAQVKGGYDYVLIDTMPSLGMLTVNALAASDSVLIPVQAQYLSAKGMTQLVRTIGKVKKQINPALKIDGILLTLVDTRTNFARDTANLLWQNYGSVLRIFKTQISKTGFVTIDTNRYGVSPELAGRLVQAKLWFDKIEIFHDHQRLKTFRRNYGKNQECLDWRDYLPTLVKKPGAATETTFFSQMPKLWQQHLQGVQGAERKSALLLLSEIARDGDDALCDEALRMASKQGLADTESIRQ